MDFSHGIGLFFLGTSLTITGFFIAFLVINYNQKKQKQKVLNLLSKGDNVAWSTIQSRFELESPRSMIDTLRAEGYMIYGNRVNGKKYYRMGTPTTANVSAGIKALYGTPFRYNNHKVSVKKSDLIALDA